MSTKEAQIFYPESPIDWQRWLHKNHTSNQSVWIVFYKKNSNEKSISWSEAVDVALCFGWIDSKKQKIDEYSYRQFFSKRKPFSTWSKINRLKVKGLINNKRMTFEGLKSVEIAKKNGSWNLIDQVEQLIIPEDLKKIIDTNYIAKTFFEGLSKSQRKIILSHIILSKKELTRIKRIEKVVKFLGEKKVPPI